MKCPKCIFDNPEGAKFCIECGHKFGEELARPIEGTTECIAKLHEAGMVVGCDTGYTRDASTALRKILKEKFNLEFDGLDIMFK